MSPCDECGQAPARGGGLCWGCLYARESARRRAAEPDDAPEATDAEIAAAESAWERHRTREPL